MINSSLQLEKFLGRVEELDTVSQAIGRATNDIIFLTGFGGIGKTRFLQEIRLRYSDETKYIVPDIIDYDDYMPDFKSAIKDEIIKKIGEKYFQRYSEEIKNKESDIRISQHRKKDIQAKFAEGFNSGVGDKKFVLLIDTLEKVTSLDFWDNFIGDLEGLKHCNVILSGRGKRENENLQAPDKLYQYLDTIKKKFDTHQQLKGKFTIDSLELESFDETICKEYFELKSKILGINDTITSSDAFACIEILTNGRPIMLDAITELVVRDKHQDDPLKFLQEKFELYDCIYLARYDKEKLDNKKEEFERRSIEHLNVGDNQFDALSLEEKVVIYLHFIRFINRKMIEELFGTISDEAFERIQKIVYTKALKFDDKITLHDKMEDLLQKYLLSFSNSFKLEVYKKVIKILEQQLETKEKKKNNSSIHDNQFKYINRQYQLLQKDIMRLEFLIDEIEDSTKLSDETFEKYKKLFNEVKLHHYREFALELVWLAGEHEQYINKNLKQKTQHTVHYTDALTLNNQPQKAIQRLEEYKNATPDLTGEELLLIDNALANSYGFMGDLQKAYSLQLGVYEGTSNYQGVKGDLQKEIFAQNHIGNLLLQMTKFHEAEQHLKQVIQNIKTLLIENPKEKELFQTKDSFLIIEASAYSHLSNIYRFNGEYEIALSVIESADKIWNEIQSFNNINLISNIRKGDIYRSEGEILKSTMAFNDAKKEIKANVNDKIEIDLNLSIALLRLFESQKYNQLDEKQNAKKEELLNEAQTLCEKSLLECYDDTDTNKIVLMREYVETNAYLTHILLEQNKPEEAFKATIEQYKIAKERDIPFYMLDAIVSLPEMQKDIADYHQDIETIQKEYGEVPAYALLLGRLKRFEADRLFENQNYSEAFKLYAQAIAKIDLHGGYGQYHIREELKKIVHKLESLDDKKHYFTIFKEELQSIKSIKEYSKDVQGWIKNEEFEI